MAPKRKQNGRSTKTCKQQPDKSKKTARLQPAGTGAKIAKSKKPLKAKTVKNAMQGTAPNKQQRFAARAMPSFNGPSAILRHRSITPAVTVDDYDTLKRPQLWKLLEDRNMKRLSKKQDCINSLRADDAAKSDSDDGVAEDARSAEHALSKQDMIHNIGSDKASFTQKNVTQDDESLYRAFAVALLDNEDRWTSTRLHTREWWNLVTLNANRGTPESQQRLPWYRAMNEESLNGAFAKVLDDYHNNADPMSPTHRKREDCSNLSATITMNQKIKAGGDLHILLVLADAFDVKLVVQEPVFHPEGTFKEWITHVRGRGGALPIHLARYPTIGRWTALEPEYEGYCYLDAVKQPELHKYRCPLTRSAQWYPEINGRVAPYIVNRSEDVPTESLLAKEAKAKGEGRRMPRFGLASGPADRRGRESSVVSDWSTLSDVERRLEGLEKRVQ